MAYQKTVWKDQDVENPRTYVMRNNGDDTVTLLDAFGEVTELGTPVNAENMNKIENGIAYLETYINTILSKIWKVGSVYLDTGNSATCPIAELIPNSEWQLVATDKALWGGNGSNGNSTINAGLPNIKGNFQSRCLHYPTETPYVKGALYAEGFGDSYRQNGGGTDGTNNVTIAFDASRSNSIYGASSTVQPPAYRVNVWRRTA